MNKKQNGKCNEETSFIVSTLSNSGKGKAESTFINVKTNNEKV